MGGLHESAASPNLTTFCIALLIATCYSTEARIRARPSQPRRSRGYCTDHTLMGPALAGAMSNLSLRSQTRPAIPTAFCSAHRIGFSSLAGQRLFHSEATPVRCTASPSGFFVVAKQNAKQRQRLAEKQRQYNKSHKSAVGTRSKKVIKALADFNLRLPESEDDLKPVDVFLAEAYQEIDKAISKGILHKNTGARRKSKLAIARQKLLIKAGLYVPAATTA